MRNKLYLILLIGLCLFFFTGCTKGEKTKLIEGTDYNIKGVYSGNSVNTSKRGYYINTLNEPNAPYSYIICMGQKNTGGYSLKVTEVNKVDEKVEIIVEEKTPGDNDMVTSAITYPTVVVEFPEYQKNIVIKNTKGETFKKLD